MIAAETKCSRDKLLMKLTDPYLRSEEDCIGLCVRHDLSGLDLRNGDWEGVRFRECDLRRAVFPEFLRGAVFYRCLLDGAILDGSDLDAVEFDKCSMTGLRAHESRWFGGVQLSSCKADQMDVSGSVIMGVGLYRTDISGLVAKRSVFLNFNSWQDPLNVVYNMTVDGSCSDQSGRIDIFDTEGTEGVLLLDAWRYQKGVDEKREARRTSMTVRWILGLVDETRIVPKLAEIRDYMRHVLSD